MADYQYPNNTITFGTRDNLPPGDTDKIISGVALDVEFIGVTNGKLDKSGTDFDGTITDETAIIDGGTF